MKPSLTNFTWLESWEGSKPHNIDVGFNDHSLLRGQLLEDTFACVDQLPDIGFFLELAKLKPKLYAGNEMTYGELTCHVNNQKYKVIYYYDKNCYMVLDENDTILKKLEVRNT
ncbi:hypothetical protein [Faecalispora jeddahensis]|uniref:hypothetical protein n=1 Tax=Faecalispora jeddahensis TaxID=1414721 RepID=UPI00189BBC16|nr:hypothetical protein [Faecalispora jeddahensis]